MKRIYKYPVPLTDDFTLALPRNAQILTVQMQHEKPQLWALVDPAVSNVERNFIVRGTGHPVDDEGLEYINTFQLANGTLVFHLFEQL